MYHSAMPPEQSAQSHASSDKMFLSILLVLAINVIVACVHAFSLRDFYAIWNILVALALLFAAYKIRPYTLKVQDRIIRLEERLRLQALAPSEWHSQIYKLSEDQLIGLRFASDDEVVVLAKLALEQNLNRKQIKERIKTWRPDNWRV